MSSEIDDITKSLELISLDSKYNKLVNIFAKENCKLLTTEEEYKKLIKEKGQSICKFEFIATCGHNNSVTLTNFVSKKSGLLCKNCNNLKMSETLKTNHQNFLTQDEGNCYGTKLENDAYHYISELINEEFNIIKTTEGCLADFLIKPKNIIDDKWVKIQLKSTTGVNHSLYSFRVTQSYPDCVMMCVCLKDNKVWAFHYEIIAHLVVKLNIGSKNSKYNKYLVTHETIIETLSEFYSNTVKFKKSDCLSPISDQQIQEQCYRQMRDSFFDWLVIDYPNRDGTVYDFKINNFKFQEKVSSLQKGKLSNSVLLYCNYGKNNKSKRQYRAYIVGENDFYWIWMKNTRKFYLFAEHVLLEHGYVKYEKEVGRIQFGVYPDLDGDELLKRKTYWANDYLFDIDKFDKKKFDDCIGI